MAERAQLRKRGEYRAWRAIATRWMDNDVYGHVNNVVYYSFFDTAVNAWLVEHGLLGRKRDGSEYWRVPILPTDEGMQAAAAAPISEIAH